MYAVSKNNKVVEAEKIKAAAGELEEESSVDADKVPAEDDEIIVEKAKKFSTSFWVIAGLSLLSIAAVKVMQRKQR